MMRAGITVKVTPDDRRRLEAIVSDRNAPQKHVWRAKIILATADGCGTSEIMRRSGKAKPVVWRWQARFMAEGVEGLTRDKTRKPGKPPLPAATVQRVVDLALSAPPGEASHWTGRMLAKAAGVSLRSVQRILEAHQLAPHRIRTFKLSNDPKFAEKLKDIVGLYVDPPAHAVVLSVDEKSQIQALDRTQPGLPMKPGRAGTMTHDYKRHGTTTLFAALNVLDGTVIGQNMKRHRHQEFIRFLNAIEARVPKRKAIHAVVDNYATHKHPKVREWLARHPRWTFHFTPTSASWLNAVETFFAKLTRRRLIRGVFRSVDDLKAAINRFVLETNAEPKPFIWTADPNRVLAAVKRGKQALESIHRLGEGPPNAIYGPRRPPGRRSFDIPSDFPCRGRLEGRRSHWQWVDEGSHLR
jgi:transposase